MSTVDMFEETSQREVNINTGTACKKLQTCICAVLQQRHCSLHVACSCCLEEGCLIVAISSMHACTRADEQLHSLCAATVCCQVESCCAILQRRYRLSMPVWRWRCDCLQKAQCPGMNTAYMTSSSLLQLLLQMSSCNLTIMLNFLCRD